MNKVYSVPRGTMGPPMAPTALALAAAQPAVRPLTLRELMFGGDVGNNVFGPTHEPMAHNCYRSCPVFPPGDDHHFPCG